MKATPDLMHRSINLIVRWVSVLSWWCASYPRQDHLKIKSHRQNIQCIFAKQRYLNFSQMAVKFQCCKGSKSPSSSMSSPYACRADMGLNSILLFLHPLCALVCTHIPPAFLFSKLPLKIGPFFPFSHHCLHYQPRRLFASTPGLGTSYPPWSLHCVLHKAI